MSDMIDIAAYQKLGNAVVLQAVRDYQRAYKKRARYPEDETAKDDCRKLEKFFRSEEFNLFTELDGPALLERLQKTLEEKANGNAKAG